MGLDTLPTQANGVSTGQKAQEVEEAGLHSQAQLGGGRVLTLYHQTSYEAGQSILKTGFRLGHGGICGPAIYFSPTAKDTDVKAVGGRGFIIEAQVDMGRMQVMSGLCDNTLTASKVEASPFDSITLDRGFFAEC